jgi:outer membrane receptor for ferrienterochelin and colicin
MMMPKRSPYRMTRVALALGAAGMLAAVPIAAQQAPSTAPEEEGTQKVVITANKRPQKQREVAGTISVLQGSDLEQRGATSQEDALRLTPGVQLTKEKPRSTTSPSVAWGRAAAQFAETCCRARLASICRTFL